MIQIKRNNANLLVVNNPLSSSNYSKAVMGEEQITLVWEQPTFLQLNVGDYIVYEGSDFAIIDPKKLPTVKELSSRFYQYNSIFESTKAYLAQAIYFLFDNTNTIPSSEFTMSGTAETFMELLVSNLNRVAGYAKWTLGDVISGTEYKTLTFSDEDCLSVIGRLSDEYDTEYHIENYTLSLIWKSTDREITLEYGSTLYDIERSSVNSSDIFTRLYAFGSSKNIAANYRGGSTKLLLPAPDTYLQHANAALYGIIEKSKTFENIYPRLSSGSAGTITAVGNEFTFTDSHLDFNVNDCLLDGTTAKVRFNTGECAGYDFEIASYNNSTKTFKIIASTGEKDFTLPTAELKPAIGNKYVLLDIVMPATYVTAGELEVKDKGLEYLNANATPKVNYKATFSAVYAKQHVQNIECGDTVPVVDNNIGINERLRIVKITKGITDFHNVQFDLSNTVTKTTLQRMAGDVANVTNQVVVTNERVNKNNLQAYKNTKELKSMVFDPDGYFDTKNIKPLSIETSMLSVGSKSQSFQLSCTLQPNYLNNPQVITWSAGTLAHFTLVDDEIKEWVISAGSLTIATPYANIPLYIYARCSRTETTGDIYLSPDATKFDADVMNWMFLIGVLHTPINNVRGISLSYGETTINGANIKTGIVSSRDGKTYFNLDTGAIGGKITFLNTDDEYVEVGAGIAAAQEAAQTYALAKADLALTTSKAWADGKVTAEEQRAINDATTKANAAQAEAIRLAAIDAKAKADEALRKANENATGEVARINASIAALQSQVDGEVNNWFYPQTPSLTSYPVTEWDTVAKKDAHVGDTFTNTQQFVNNATTPNAGKSWRFLKDAGVYSWSQIADSDAVLALQKAGAAQSTADGKCTTFLMQPTIYKKGDIWILAVDWNGYKAGEMLNASQDSATFVTGHWTKWVKYTDDSAVTNLKIGGSNLLLGSKTFAYFERYTAPLVAGETYIFSIAAHTNGAYMFLHLYPPGGDWGSDVFPPVDCNSNHKYERIFVAPVSGVYKFRATEIVGELIVDKYPMLELGNKPSSYKEAPEDIQARIDAAKTAADKGISDAKTGNDTLARIADDNWITAQEKPSLVREYQSITGEVAGIRAQADSFGVSLTAYNTVYSALTGIVGSNLDNLTTDWSLGSGGGVNLRNAFNNYYLTRTSLQNNSVIAARKAGLDAGIKVDGLQIGGVNLLSQTDFAKTDKWIAIPSIQVDGTRRFVNCAANFSCGQKVKTIANQVYVFSFFARNLGADDRAIVIKLDDENHYSTARTIPANTGWIRYSLTITAYQTLLQSLYIRADSGNCDVSLPQFECGNIATDWTESAEDAQARIDSIQIGTRNLIRNSGAEVSKLQASAYPVLMQRGKEYCGAIMAKSDRTVDVLMYFLDNTTGSFADKLITLTPSYKQYSITGLCPANWNVAQGMIIIYSTNAALPIATKEASVVEGNRPLLSWLEAPEDTQARLDNIRFSSRNLIANSKINETSWRYGFAKRTANLVAGKEYTLSANARINGNQAGRMYLLEMTRYENGVCDVLDVWVDSLIDSTSFGTFTAKYTGTYEFSSYNYPSGSADTVTANWYALVEGNKPMIGWMEAPEDTQARLDNLKSGGRNFILNSNFIYGETDWNMNFDPAKGEIKPVTARITTNLPLGSTSGIACTTTAPSQGLWNEWKYPLGDYMLSFWVKSSINNTMLVGYELNLQTIAIGTTWQFVKIPFTATVARNLVFYAMSACTYYLTNVMLTGGNMLMDWTPATEDAFRKISETDFIKEIFTNANQATTGGDVRGGSWMTNLLRMRGIDGKVRGGMSGLAGDNVGNWTGGDYEDALNSEASPERVAGIDRKDGSGHRAKGKLLWTKEGMLRMLGGFIGNFSIIAGKIIGLDTTGAQRLILSTEAVTPLSEMSSSATNIPIELGGRVVESVNGYASVELSVFDNFSLPLATKIDVDYGQPQVTFSNPNAVVSQDVSFAIHIWRNGAIIASSETGNQINIPNAGYLQVELRITAIISTREEREGRYEETDVTIENAMQESRGIMYMTSVARTEIGSNGISSFWGINNFFRYTQTEGMSVKGKTNMPGVLAAGACNQYGQFIAGSGWGAKHNPVGALKASDTAGHYYIYHNIGHTNFVCTVNSRTEGAFVAIGVKYNDTVEIFVRNKDSRMDGAFEYMIVGDNA